MQRGLVGSEMCIRDRYQRRVHGAKSEIMKSELGLCAKLHKQDERNFHCWNYKSWLLTVELEHCKKDNPDEAKLPVSYTHLTLPTILLVQISVVAVSLKKKKIFNKIL
eukprot:TRINITY_DN24283_c0_g1_i1.p2 TRINITY_DN24283_c0_g1~~TRINITY_DN24283_c0_g1_i1.p2  ORF type:complete len:108 (+),score=46.69 TRINITY_DN24283_c0_g1_i1:160-483(+)